MKILFVLFFTCLTLFPYAQEGNQENVVQVFDKLTINWDDNAETLETYEGLNRFCRDRFFRNRITGLLDDIHHYDTLLYGIVTTKYADSKDPEAKATLDDILELEADYKTLAFKKFLRDECQLSNEIESNYGGDHGKEYQKERNELEAELKKYVIEITELVDVIDEHLHHLDLD